VKPNHIDWHLKFAQEQHLPLNYIPFKGKHEILTDVLLDFFENEIKVKI
jgi:tripartite-type tricarboxylate transporter receptor subunit TctC